MNVDQMQMQNVKVERVSFKGREALKVSEDLENAVDGHAVAIIGGSSFQDGVIEGYMAGTPYEGAIEGARGFVGIAFRVQREAAKFECLYIRPTNGRG